VNALKERVRNNEVQSNVKLNKYSVIFVLMRLKDESKIHAIFKATLAIVKERGLVGITMNDISKAASIGTGTLYIYFQNKDELIKTLFVACRQHSANHYFEGLQQTVSFEERMQRVFTNIIGYKMQYFDKSIFLEQFYHSPFVCTADFKKKEKALAPLYDLIEEGICNKSIKDVNMDLIVSYTFGIINEIVKKAHVNKKKLPPETIEQLYAMYWDGIKRQA